MASAEREQWVARFRAVRRATEQLTTHLEPDDFNLQPMADASPVKWHLAHTAWFFETFVLSALPGYTPFDPRFEFLFNSYYESVGPRFPRPKRGLLSRPTAATVFAYRAHVDDAVSRLIATADAATWGRVAPVVELGLQHEQQHQELIVTDLLYAFYQNPLRPAVFADEPPDDTALSLEWLPIPAGVAEIGHAGGGFAFDNESPRHRVYLHACELASRPVTNGEFLQFIDDGGYIRPNLWLSDGWAARRDGGWTAPLYWEHDRDWTAFTPHGTRPLNADAAACHLSYYEADAYARWAGARLPTEAEWEVAARDPRFAGAFDRAWQWTASPYTAYPGYRAAAGALGEYNGKFMCNQMVLRGGSAATPHGHSRPTYRNFFPPDARWQFSGLRLARFS